MLLHGAEHFSSPVIAEQTCNLELTQFAAQLINDQPSPLL
jgi:hypothetical protein